MRATSTLPVGLFRPGPDPANLLGRQTEKDAQPLDPLFEQLPAMHEDQRIRLPLGDQPRPYHGLSEGGGGREHAGIMLEHGLGGRFLLRSQFAVKRQAQRATLQPLVADDRSDAEVVKKLSHIVQAAARQADVEWGILERRPRCAACHRWKVSSPGPCRIRGFETPPAESGDFGGRRTSLLSRCRVHCRGQSPGSLAPAPPAPVLSGVAMGRPSRASGPHLPAKKDEPRRRGLCPRRRERGPPGPGG